MIYKSKEININLVVQASASQGDGVALVEALKSTTTVDQLAQCLHCVAAATRIPVVALPTDRAYYKLSPLLSQPIFELTSRATI